MKKKTIFRLFLVPLILIMVIQALISYGTFTFSGTPFLLNDYAVGMLNQTVENRRINLENDMIQSWSDIAQEEEKAEAALLEVLGRTGLKADTFLQDDAAKQYFLSEMAGVCLEVLRKNVVTGSFIVLADLQKDGTSRVCSGLYLRDSDPSKTDGNYSDVLAERGSSALAHEINVPLDTFWTKNFRFEESGVQREDNFFYMPYEAALKHKDAGSRNLGYWSPSFYLEYREQKDSYNMITYSIPLIHDDVVYGVLGVELSTQYLAKQLPSREVDDHGTGGYILGQYTEDGVLIPLVSTVSVPGEWSEAGVPVGATQYDTLRKIDFGSGSYYASISRLHLYNNNTPFPDAQWVLAGVQDETMLFGMSSKIVRNILLAILFGLAAGICGSYFIVSHLTRPIRRLAECIVQSSGNRLQEYRPSNIREVDRLYEVVKALTLKQQETELSLKEEKERYRIALESSTDILFSLDLGNQMIDIFNVENTASGPEIREYHLDFPRLEELICTAVHEDDRKILDETLRTAIQEVHVVFEVHLEEMFKGYRWVELRGRVIYDAGGQKSKIIGSIKNMHEQKIQELAQLDTIRRDPVTRLYRRNIGVKLIEVQLEKGETGCLAMLDMDKFRELDDRYGLTAGDAILEKIGSVVLDMKQEVQQPEKRMILAVRSGGDEILLWLEHYNEKEAEAFAEEFNKRTKELYPGTDFILQACTGISVSWEGCSFKALEEQASKALVCAKAGGGAKTAVYSRLTQEQLKRCPGCREVNDIINVSYSHERSMIPVVFNFFDKSSDLRNLLPIVLSKLGESYGLGGIIISQAEPEYHTVHLAYQWHKKRAEWLNAGVFYFTPQEYEELTDRMSAGSLEFTDNWGMTEENFYYLAQGYESICAALHDNGIYTGCITYLRSKDKEPVGDSIRKELLEISRIIESNINREKYDLASRAKSDFLSRMSHEIRTPMNAIMGMTEIAVQKKDEPDKVEDCLTKIGQSSKYLLGLINDILDMSKIESGKMKLETSEFSLKVLCEGVCALLQGQMDRRSICFEVRTKWKECWVKGDPLRLNQVLINLLSNAAKFTPADGKVILSVDQKVLSDDCVETCFSVEDTGIGISEDNRLRIFRSFEQADSNTSRKYGGTGLGLAISESLVRMMGGQIELESEVGKGSRFYFSLLQNAAQPQDEAGAAKPAGGSQDICGKRILLVEDNALNMEIARTILEMQDIETEEARDGQEAVRAFLSSEEYYYDMILMDIRMPVMDGLEAARQIRRQQRADAKTIPIAAMSANAFDEDVKNSLDSGMNEHLSKPINVEELLGVIRRLTEA